MEVSVVIPNYNGIAFLDSVLASLEGQTLKNFEVIFVDNGSSDGSCSFVAGINRGCTSIMNCLENYGFCRAVNVGIKAARAPYVLLLNNDHRSEGRFSGRDDCCDPETQESFFLCGQDGSVS